MRILRFMGYPINNFSTLERMMLEQAKSLKAQGHQVDIAYDGIRRPEAAEAARAHAPGIDLHFGLPDRFGIGQPKAALQYARAASELIGKGKYDIVHLYFDPSARLLNQVARLHPRVRFLRTIGSTPLPRGSRRYLDPIKRKKWAFDTSQMKRVICVGEHISAMLGDFGVARDKLIVVPNATDVDRFNRRMPHQHSDILRLGFVGRMNPVKNIPLIIDGMRLLVEQGVRDVELTLVGSGELREQLLAQVANNGLQSYVKFAGHVDDIPAMLNRDIDVYVQASRNEGCPAAVIEAMACEVPVLLSDIPGHRQVAIPDVHATYFADDDAEQFAAAVRRIKHEYPRYRDMAIRARQHIVDTYSINAWISKELAVYQSLMHS
jgi:glycosyltransferase involved in cell wall biosynthesis